jgi:hypothetical protein
MNETIDFHISLCPIKPLRMLAFLILALTRLFIGIIDVISQPQFWAAPEPEYRPLYAPLPWLMRRMIGIHPLFLVAPQSYLLRRKRKKAITGTVIMHLQQLDALEDSAMNTITLFYARKKRLSRLKRKAAANRKFRQRRSWYHFKNSMTPNQFRRYFRMSK